MRIEFNKLHLGYRQRATLENFSAMIPRGAKVAITGENGAGKSTLLKTIAGLLKPLAGSLQLKGEGSCAYLAQQCEIDRQFPVTVRALLRMGLWQKCGLWGRQRSYDSEIEAALTTTGLTALAERPIHTLSGGQLQRALFARIIVQNADLILLDEPFNGVDVRTQTQLLKLTQRWQSEGRTVLIATHHPQQIEPYCTHILHLCNRQAEFLATKRPSMPMMVGYGLRERRA